MRYRIAAMCILAALHLVACGAKVPNVISPSQSSDAQTATPPLPNAATSDVREVRTGITAHLVTVRLARHDGYDRLVLEFADRVPGYTVGYPPGSCSAMTELSESCVAQSFPR